MKHEEPGLHRHVSSIALRQHERNSSCGSRHMHEPASTSYVPDVTDVVVELGPRVHANTTIPAIKTTPMTPREAREGSSRGGAPRARMCSRGESLIATVAPHQPMRCEACIDPAPRLPLPPSCRDSPPRRMRRRGHRRHDVAASPRQDVRARARVGEHLGRRARRTANRYEGRSRLARPRASARAQTHAHEVVDAEPPASAHRG
ncbi:MAG: hypothetical protein K0S65_1070 [Labilithrix sp.]|nr:hypothetical protein [Labilithrix sp.]